MALCLFTIFRPGTRRTGLNIYCVFCVLCPLSCYPVSCVWKKIMVRVLRNSKHYRSYVSLFDNKCLAHIGTHRSAHWWLMWFTIIRRSRNCTIRMGRPSLTLWPWGGSVSDGWPILLVQVLDRPIIVIHISHQWEERCTYGAVTQLQWSNGHSLAYWPCTVVFSLSSRFRIG